MKCNNCGKELGKAVKFCTACGHPVGKDVEPKKPQPVEINDVEPEKPLPAEINDVEPEKPQPVEMNDAQLSELQSAPTTAPYTAAPEEPATEQEQPSEMRSEIQAGQKPALTSAEKAAKLKKTAKIAGIILGTLVVCALVVYLAFGAQLSETCCERGYASLEEHDFYAAARNFKTALKLDSDNDRASLGLVQAYVYAGDYRQAQIARRRINSTDSDISEKLAGLDKIIELKPSVEPVATESFPYLSLFIDCEGEVGYIDPSQVKVTENGLEQELIDVRADYGTIVVDYASAGSVEENERREVTVDMSIDGVPTAFQADYSTPLNRGANVSLVSVDTTDYPVVRAYYKLETIDGRPIDNIPVGCFQLKERLSGGDYLKREITQACQVDKGSAMSVNMVADLSSSIASGDMSLIKQVMKQFFSNMDFSGGDKAALMGFNTKVYIFSTFSDDESSLCNAVDSMSIDGSTALYDALVSAVNRVAAESGSRCVIAFTDGLDNSSGYYPDEVAQYAIDHNIPVFIIGVGDSVDSYTLESIATQTQGKYWHISDLQDLADVYDSIYRQQQKLYVVEYTTDESCDRYASRDLELVFSGNGYEADYSTDFQPKQVITDDGGVAVYEPGRYDIIVSDVGWAEAKQECERRGGHLVTITSQEEFNLVTNLAEDAGAKFVWTGGYTYPDSQGNLLGAWITNEPFSFDKWCVNQPSGKDTNGALEEYIILWNLDRPDLGEVGWSFNDVCNDPTEYLKYYKGSLAYVCEYE